MTGKFVLLATEVPSTLAAAKLLTDARQSAKPSASFAEQHMGVSNNGGP